MSKLITAAAMACAVAALAGAAHADDTFQPKQAGHFMLNVRVTDVAPSGKDPILTSGGVDTTLQAKVGSSVMPTIGITYFFTDNIAGEVIAGTTKHTIKAVNGAGAATEVRDQWVLPPTVSLQYHFAPAGRISPYVGAGVNYMLFYSGKNKNGFHDVKVDNGFGWALQAGVDIATSGPWSVNVDVKKIFFTTDASVNHGALVSRVHLDPLVASVGFGYKF